MLRDSVTGLGVVSVYAVVELVAAVVVFVVDAAAGFSAPLNFHIARVHACITSVPGFFVVLSRAWALHWLTFLFSYLVCQGSVHASYVSDVTSCCTQAVVLDGLSSQTFKI